jgi:hypothetical protein
MERSGITVWDAPFNQCDFPSVGLVVEPDGVGTALLVVAPGGLDAYPKYLVRFTDVFSVTCGEEAGFEVDLGQTSTPGHATAYVWDASPHSAAYANTAYGANMVVRHYVVFGGDNIASVVSGAAPVIEVVPAPTALSVRYAV